MGRGEQVVEGLFGKLASKKLTIEWVGTLYCRGSAFTAGESWLSATLDGKPILAFVPVEGIFKVTGKIYFLLQLYVAASTDEYGLLTLKVPSGYKPRERIVHVDSAMLQDLVPLSPALRTVRGHTTNYRFVPLL